MKVGICIPSKSGSVAIEWAWRLRKLKVPNGSEFFFERSPRPIDCVRESLVKEALEREMDYIFFLDDDILVGEDDLLKLMAYRWPLISACYPDKGGRACAFLDGKPFWIEDGDTAFVDEVGLGCCLIDARIFKKLSNPWFLYEHRERDDNKPSEDVYFCRKCSSEQGIKVLLTGEVKCHHVYRGAMKDPDTVVHLSL